MSTAVMTARRNQNLYRQPTKLQLGPTSATFVVIALIVVLALLYLNQITKTGLFTYKVSSLAAQRAQVLAQKQDLSVEAARLQSIQSTQATAAAHHMVPTDQVSYVR
ncbi:MAG TPA: hypothetical protein VLI05_02120 [Candidatus Saccharimonadia bacterium]|nr:hypothetical protein [Candidatus Saccharimonadia bacterium]